MSHSLKPPLGALGGVPLQILGDSGVGKAFSYKLGSDFTFSPAVYASCPSTSRPTLCCRASAMCQCDWQKLLPLCDVAPVSREGQYVFTCLNPFSLFVLRYLGSSALELSEIGVGHFIFFTVIETAFCVYLSMAYGFPPNSVHNSLSDRKRLFLHAVNSAVCKCITAGI